MRKLLDLIAVLAFLLSSSIIGGGALVYLNREKIKDAVLDQVMENLPIPSVPNVGGDSLPFSL